MFKKLGISVAHLSIVVIVLGILKEIIYYNNFNLSIQHFIDLSELGLAVSNNLLLLAVFVFLGIATSFSHMKFDGEGSKESSKKNELKKPNPKAGNYIRIIIAFFSLSAIIYFYNSYANYLMIIAAYFPVSFIFVYIYKNASVIKFFGSETNAFLFLFFTFLVAAILFYTAKEIKSVENGQYTGTVIKTNDSTYISNDTSYYIGKTNKYIFIYDSKRKGTTIIPVDKIEIINLQSK